MDVLVSGAGIGGPALAWWFARRGVRTLAVERTPVLRVGGHAIDIRGVAVDVVEQMGLHGAIRDARTRIRARSIVKPDGRGTINLDIPRARANALETSRTHRWFTWTCTSRRASTNTIVALRGNRWW